MWAPVAEQRGRRSPGCWCWWRSPGRRAKADRRSGRRTMVAVLAGSATLGVLAQALVLLPALRRVGFRWRPRWGWRGVGPAAGRPRRRLDVRRRARQAARVRRHLARRDRRRRAGPGGRRGTRPRQGDLRLRASCCSCCRTRWSRCRWSRRSSRGCRSSAAESRIDDVRADLSLGLRITGLATVSPRPRFLALGPDMTAALFVGSPRADHRRDRLGGDGDDVGLVAVQRAVPVPAGVLRRTRTPGRRSWCRSRWS